MKAPLLDRKQGSHGLDAVPEVLEAEILVCRVLVVVVVGDGNRDGAGVGGSLDRTQGNASAHGGPEDDFTSSTTNGCDHGLGDGQVHGSADSIVAGGVAHY